MEKVKIIVFSLFFFLGVLLFSGAEAPDQRFNSYIGLKYIKNYTPKEYNAPSQNWVILQDRRGIIYAANQGGVLEFDGSTWRTIAIGYGSARAMHIDDSSGTIYIGGRDELGYLEPDDKGTLTYVSLSDHLKKEDRNFSDVHQVMCTTGGVWFRTEKKLFRWHTGKFSIWDTGDAEAKFRAMFPWNGNNYVQELTVGLMQMKGNSFLPMPGSEAFAKGKIYLAVPYDDRRLLIGTRVGGFFLYDGAAAVPFPTEVDEYLKKHEFYHGIRLSTGDFALATLKGGVVVMDAQGRLKEKFNNAFGLKSNNVKYIFQDSGGNLWLALNNSIAKIDYASPVSYFDDRSGLNGLVLSVVRHKGRLFAGTDSGLYFLEPPSRETPPKFRLINGISVYCWSLISVRDSLLAATDNGVFLVDEMNRAQQVAPESLVPASFVLTASGMLPGRVWVGTKTGVFSLRQTDGQWRLETQLDHIRQEVGSMVEDDRGNLWLGTLTQGVVKVDFQGDGGNIRNPEVTQFGTADGLPAGEVYVTRAAGRVMFATSDGLFRLDETGKSFVPEMILGEKFCDGSRNVFRLVEDRNKHIWFHSNLENFRAVPKSDGTYDVINAPLLRFLYTQVNAIYPDGQSVWFATNDGLICFDTAAKKDYNQSFFALIRKVTKKEGQAVYDGFKTPRISPGVLPIFKYKERNLHFEAAAPFYDDESETWYRYFMEGYDDDWSGWTRGTSKDYTNLEAGLYTLRVQAKNVYRTPSSEDTFSFRVLPPWYLTWLAFVVYALGAGLMVYLIVKWRSWRLVLEKQRLEQVIEKRTRQINQANARLQEQNLQLEEQSEKLKEMDKVKSRFFANISHEFRTPLTLIMGPLDRIQSGCRDIGIDRQISLVKRNAHRLLKLINQLLDLSRFESGKMKLQAEQGDLVPFLRSILEPFEMAASQYRLNLVFHTDEESIPLYVDPEKLEKIMANLLSNAVKFTPPGGSITVSASVIPGTPGETETSAASEGHVTLSVKDTGVGIPHDQLPHIFDRFYQADTTVEHYHEGSGIGLALVKELVELHHGEIMVRSKKEGDDRGTEFILRFPQGKKHLKQEEMAESERLHRSPAEEESYEALLTEPWAAGEPEHEEDMEVEEEKDTWTMEKPIVLVVEDNADLREYIRTSLGPDYTVAEAKDGREGIEKAASIIPDLIISDIMMPLKDGYELCRVIKTQVSTSHIPVVLLTARSSEEDMVRGLETGADDYITKPFNTRLLRARIKNLIDLRRQLQVSINRDMLLQPSRMSLSRIDHEFLNDLKDVIEKNLSDPDFNVEDLSKKLYMSRATVYRKVLALSGETPTDFIRTCRLRRAAQLLKSQYGSVTEVAFEVGFTSRAYFTKCFKEKFHKLPSEYFSTESS